MLQQRLGTTTVYVTHDQTEAMTLGDRVAVLRRGFVQQVGTPRELYNSPDNLFFAGFIGSPAMNLLPATLEGDTLHLPMVSFPLPEEVKQRLGDRRPSQLVAGIRPEHFEDAALVGDQRDQGATFTTEIEIIEWMGAELYAHFTVHSDAKVDLSDIAEDLENAEMAGSGGAAVVARLDTSSGATERQELELWLDARRIHLFDAESGDNVQHDSPSTTASGSPPAAHTGATAAGSQ
jgi:multiple sugar transport system ATP-binding protein